VRWEALFADLDARAEALERLDRDLEISDRAQIETATIRLSERLAAGIWRQVRLRCAAGCLVNGRLIHVGPDWVLVDEGCGHEALVLLHAVLTVGGLSRHAQDAAGSVGRASTIAKRLGVRSALRRVAMDRSAVRIALADGMTIAGTIDRVGADFVDVAVHAAGELRRRDEVIESLVVGVPALVAVRRTAG